jgi:hypothetical protein
MRSEARPATCGRRAAARGLALSLACAAALSALGACGRSNPALGDWEVDRQETPRGAVLAVQAAELSKLTFGRGGATSGDTEIAGSWVVEGDVVRLVRSDGRGEHRIEVLPNDRIRVELPIGVSAVYKRAGS